MGPYSSILNIDEVDDIEATWLKISNLIGIDVPTIKTAIQPVKDLYIVLDHTRTILMIVNDGSLPSNVGGGSNVRNILRRVFAILKKNNWWELLTLKGLLELFQSHKKDLSKLYGPFQEYKSFDSIIELEYERWTRTDDSQKSKLEKFTKKGR